MTNIVVIIGANHHNTLGVIRSLGECGIMSDLIIENDTDSLFISKSRYIRNFSTCDDNSLIDVLINKYKEETRRPVVICTTDSAIDRIDQNYDKLSTFFILPNAYKQGKIHELLNKEYSSEIAERCGLNIPLSIRLTKDDNIPKNIFYPCYVKSIDSICGSKGDSCICQDEADLIVALKKNIEYQVQEYIEKDKELLLNGVSLKHGDDCFFPLVIEKIRQYPNKVGACTYCKVDMIEKYSCIDVTSIKKFLKTIRYEGVFSIEFIIKNNKAYFLEINLRNDGTAYIPTIADFKLHYIWYCYAVGARIPNKEINKQILPYFFSSDVNDIRHVFEKRLSFKDWIKDTIQSRTYLLFNKHDVKPWLYYYIYAIKRKIQKIKES